MTHVKAGIDSLVSAASAGHRVLLLFDFDGTLSPTVSCPQAAWLPSPTRRIIERLAGVGCQIGVLSGRSLADLRSRVGLPGAWYAGSGGLELWIRDRLIVTRPTTAALNAIAFLAEVVATAIASLPGVWLERKPWSLTIHHRGASAETVAAVRRLAAGLGSREPDLRVVVCSLGVELSPCPAVHKGTAAVEFVTAAGAGFAGVVYVGNDGNDAEAMAEVARRGGWSIGIGKSSPPARDVLSDPAELREVLATLAQALSRTGRANERKDPLR